MLVIFSDIAYRRPLLQSEESNEDQTLVLTASCEVHISQELLCRKRKHLFLSGVSSSACRVSWPEL